MKPTPPADDDRALEEALRRSRELADAPEALVQRAIDLFAARARAAAPPSVGLRRRLAAVLGFDSAGASGLAFGLRGGRSAERQLLYSLGERDIDLRVVPAGPARWRLAGQVLGPDAAGAAVLDGPGGERRVPWSELAEFAFEDLTAGTWTLRLVGDDWEAELPAIVLPSDGTGAP